LTITHEVTIDAVKQCRRTCTPVHDVNRHMKKGEGGKYQK